MSAEDLARIEKLLLQLRGELTRARTLPTLLTPQEAARELSVGMTKMRELMKAGVVMTTNELGRERVPRSEIDRLSRVDPPKVWLRGSESKALAASMAKVRESTPGAKETALRVRNANRSRLPAGTQDPDALRKRRR